MRSLKLHIAEDGAPIARMEVTLQERREFHEDWHVRVQVDKGPSVGHYAFMLQVAAGFNGLGLLKEVLDAMSQEMLILEGEVIDGSIHPETGPRPLAG